MDKELQNLKNFGLFRELKTLRRVGSKIFEGEKSYLDFASNDYLGLAANSEIQNEFLQSLPNTKDFLFGSASSRLLTGNFPSYTETEAEIERSYNKPCLIFNSGYHANTGLIPAICQKGDLILADKLVHASIIDGLKLSDAKYLRFAHNDYEHLRKLLAENRSNFNKVLIVSESIFSMDGDLADLHELVKIKNEFDALLYIDEAHSFGVLGKSGLGAAEDTGLISQIDFIMCTLGKALASEGAFVVCSQVWKDFFVNKTRSLIFTTALPPVSLMWTNFAFKKMRTMHTQREKLSALQKHFRDKLKGLKILGKSAIAPLLIGDENKTLELAQKLKSEGIYAPAIRYPTVAKGAARIRFSLSGALAPEEIDFCTQKILHTT